MRRISRKKAAHRASKAGQDGLAYMRTVKCLPCAVCGSPPPSDAHHVICGRYGSKRASDFDVIPLCKAHHQNGPDAIHRSKRRWIELFGLDTDYLDRTRRLVGSMEGRNDHDDI